MESTTEQSTSGTNKVVQAVPALPQRAQLSDSERSLIKARRTAFVARFIVLREGKRSRAHRVIEMMSWHEFTTAEELCLRFREIFVQNGDNMMPVDRDLRRAIAHASRSLNHFVAEYSTRSTGSFIDSLFDYERSNTLLFGADESPKPGGWRLPQELLRLQEKVSTEKSE